ncbi:MAG: SAM-dependent methyltransferase, partial [Vicinamibacterales bacterium]
VPAKVAGTWSMSNGTITLTQEYQIVQGSVTTTGPAEAVKMGRLRGDEIAFTAGDAVYQGKVIGNTIEGTMTTAQGTSPWTATRK